MKEIPLEARVECTDGSCGKSVTVILDPSTRQVTHIVVKDHESTERLVPMEQVEDTSHDLIRLRCTKHDLTEMKPFYETRYVKTGSSSHGGVSSQGEVTTYVGPRAVPTHAGAQVPVDEPQIPDGERAVHKGAKVSASDGHVGEVDELLLDPGSGQITHLILIKGHLWRKRAITVPVSTINFFDGETVYLNLDKSAIEQLPSVPFKRH